MSRLAIPHIPARPTRRVASTVVLASFGIGLIGAFGAHAVETSIAESDARAAAQELEAKRTALEGELTAAHDAIHEAQDVVDEARVAQAAHALTQATHTATESAALSGVLVSVAPLDPTEFAELTNRAEGVPESAPDAAAATPVADVVEPATKNDHEPVAGPASSTTPAASTETTPVVDAEHPLPVELVTSDVVSEEDVAKVLAGEADSAEQARATARRLEEATDALDEAAREVGSGADALSAAALEASHLDTLNAMDVALSDALAISAESSALIETVADRVRQPGHLAAAEDALVGLDSAAATAALVDRESPKRVIEEFDRLTSAEADLASAMTALRMTHEAWVADENGAIDERNEIVRAEHELAVADARATHAEANRSAVAARSNGWKGRPTGVSGTNGELSTRSLCAVDFAPGHRLQCDAARALEDANAAYRAETGRDLTMTDSYRSYGLQVRTRALKPATAARPGTSNHGWGMAADLDRPSSAWLTANGAEFGWVHPRWARPGGDRPEFWHLEYVATDVGAFNAPAAPDLESPVESAFAPTPGKAK